MNGYILASHRLFTGIQSILDDEQVLREALRTICKDVDQLSREAMVVLQVIHRENADIPAACAKAREFFAEAKEGYATLRDAVPPGEYYKHNETWRVTSQRFCFLIMMTVWLEKGSLVSHDTVAEILGLQTIQTERNQFHLDIEDFLMGLLQFCTEMARLAVNSVTIGDYKRPVAICKFVMIINTNFRLLNLKSETLRKRYEALRYDMQKIEEVVYDLRLRGLLEENGL